jgi:hypothetical protein
MPEEVFWFVIPAEAGIQGLKNKRRKHWIPGYRRYDEKSEETAKSRGTGPRPRIDEKGPKHRE